MIPHIKRGAASKYIWQSHPVGTRMDAREAGKQSQVSSGTFMCQTLAAPEAPCDPHPFYVS